MWSLRLRHARDSYSSENRVNPSTLDTFGCLSRRFMGWQAQAIWDFDAGKYPMAVSKCHFKDSLVMASSTPSSQLLRDTSEPKSGSALGSTDRI